MCMQFCYDSDVSIESGCFFFFQAEDGIRDLVRSRGLGDVYKRQLDKPVHLHRIRLQESPQRRIVVSRIVKIQPARRIVQHLSLIHI